MTVEQLIEKIKQGENETFELKADIRRVAPNDRGYGHGRFAGAFAVALRQSECGRKTC